MSQQTPTVTGLLVKDEGVTIANPANSLDFVGAGVTATAVASAVTATIAGAAGTEVRNEHPTDNGDGTYTIAHTPVAGTVQVYRNGQRLNVGAGNDYTISGAVITYLGTYSAADIITADYLY